MKTSDLWKDRAWRLLVFHRAMVHLSVALILCALIAGLYRQRVYFSFAASAAGVLLLAWAWRERCAWQDGRPLRREAAGVPYLLRKEKKKRPHRPAFLMTSRDFDDDLTPYTAVGEDAFSDAQRRAANLFSCLLSGALMILFSFVI
ncbi:MAG: hypothetical protein IKQ41_05275 [Clostridia bacterium]|nr:hypothetical protein [Clostridia bacterium]